LEGGASDWSGTVAYMAPERIRGQAGDARADVFALGVVLYEMLAGTRPFAGENDAAVGAAIVSDEPPPLTGTPPAVQQFVQRCLAKDPDERWQTAHDLAEALSWLSRESDASARGSPRRSSWRLAGFAAVAAA